MWPILNSFQDRDISLYSCKIVDKKEILCTVSDTSIYCTSGKVGIVYLVQYIFGNSAVNIRALCSSCEDMACCSSECLFTFPNVCENIHYVIEQFVLCIHFSSVYISLHSVFVAS